MKTINISKFRELSPEEQDNFTGIIKWPNGRVEFIKKNKLHREDGPAVECPGGYKEYYLNDKFIKNCNSDEALKLYVDLLRLKGIKV